MNQKSGISYPDLAFVLFGILFFSLFFGWHTIGLAETKAECTVTLTPDQSIQKAVDKVQTGSVICLAEGRWEEEVDISKSLTLKGLRDKPEIYTAQTNSTTIFASGKGDLVKLQDLKISTFEKNGYSSWPIIWGSAPLEIDNCIISSTNEYEKPCGIAFSPRKKSEPRDLRISNTVFKNTGVWIYPPDDRNKSLKALIQNSIIKNSPTAGLKVIKDREHQYKEYKEGQAEVRLEDSVIKSGGNLYEDVIAGTLTSGVVLGDGAKAEIVDSTISDNTGDGIFLYQSGEATIDGSVVENNGRNGVSLWDLSNMTISDTKISNNSGSGISLASWSRYAGNELEGNVLYQHEQLPSNTDVSIKSNEITNNEKYGVFIYTDKCPINQLKPRGMEVIGFWGKVTGKSNSITDNGREDICPTGLSFLQSEEGGKYSPPEGSTDREEE